LNLLQRIPQNPVTGVETARQHSLDAVHDSELQLHDSAPVLHCTYIAKLKKIRITVIEMSRSKVS